MKNYYGPASIARVQSLWGHANDHCLARTRALVRVLIVCAAVASMSLTARAQIVRRVMYRNSCTVCQITFIKVASLGGPADSVLVSPVSTPVWDSKGRYYASSIDNYQVIVFDAAGRILRTLGRRGEGPGEFSSPGIRNLAVGPGDSLLVFQFGRLSVFTSEGLHVRTVRTLPASITYASALSDGRLVVAANFRSPATFGFPYHLLDPNGNVVKSFGDPYVGQYMDDSDTPKRLDDPPPPFALSPDQKSIWSAPGYHVREWMLDGRLRTAIDIAASPWHLARRDTTMTDRMGTKRPVRVGGSEIDILGVDRRGMIWVRTAQPATARKKGVYAVEVVDSRSGAVVASTQAPGYLRRFTDDKLVTIAEDSDGVFSFAVWRVQAKGW